ncbi:MAG: WYL domain-containing transcriptional regulator [Deltaproteobacteria bacterium]|nr:WYL domain-containing transcriptional regulator [Deltaproteobacteria bacterium]
MTVSIFRRVLEIIDIIRSGKSFMIDDLTKKFKVNKRTLYRDINKIRKLGIPVKINNETKQYFFAPGLFLPPTDLESDDELNLLRLALVSKIQKGLANTSKFKFQDSSIDKIKLDYFALTPRLEQTILELENAIEKKAVVKINYLSQGKRKSITTNLNPYLMMFSNNIWYIIGNSSYHKKFYHFKISRIQSFEITKDKFNRNGFSARKYTGRAWSLESEGELYDVKLRFDKKISQDVMAIHWHHTQKTICYKDGSITMEFCVDGLDEITRWIMGYGDKVEVISPNVLREKLCKMAQGVVERCR